EGNLYPTAGHYGEFSATMGQLGLPSSGIGARGQMNLKDVLLAAADRVKAGGLVPDVPIAEVQDVRVKQAEEQRKTRLAETEAQRRKERLEAEGEQQRKLTEARKDAYLASRLRKEELEHQ